MAKITKDQVNKINAKCKNGFYAESLYCNNTRQKSVLKKIFSLMIQAYYIGLH